MAIFSGYLGRAALSDQGWGGTLGSRFPLGRLVRLTNTRTDKRDKYILPLGQIHLPFGQIHFIQNGKMYLILGPSEQLYETDSGDKREKRVEGH